MHNLLTTVCFYGILSIEVCIGAGCSALMPPMGTAKPSHPRMRGNRGRGLCRAHFTMQQWFRIKCPNKRRGHAAVPCDYTLCHVNGTQRGSLLCVICPACGAQCFVEFNKAGACSVYIPAAKKYLPSEKHPLYSKGEFVKTKDRK